MTVETDIAELKVSVSKIEKSMDRMDKFMMGNGSGGMLDRVTRVEENLRRMDVRLEEEVKENCETSKNNTNLLKELSKSFEETRNSFLEHIRNENLHSARGLLLNKSTLSAMIIFFVVLHVLLPPELNIFSLLLKFLGL